MLTMTMTIMINEKMLRIYFDDGLMFGEEVCVKENTQETFFVERDCCAMKETTKRTSRNHSSILKRDFSIVFLTVVLQSLRDCLFLLLKLLFFFIIPGEEDDIKHLSQEKSSRPHPELMKHLWL